LREKKITKFIVRLTGEWKKAILENFGYFWNFLEKKHFLKPFPLQQFSKFNKTKRI
jgi:hypothetical protein